MDFCCLPRDTPRDIPALYTPYIFCTSPQTELLMLALYIVTTHNTIQTAVWYSVFLLQITFPYMKTFCQLEQLPALLQVMQISHFLHSDLQGQKMHILYKATPDLWYQMSLLTEEQRASASVPWMPSLSILASLLRILSANPFQVTSHTISLPAR